jgi:hypothetical protein
MACVRRKSALLLGVSYVLVTCQHGQISNRVLLYTGLKEDKITSRDLEHQLAAGFNGTVADRPYGWKLEPDGGLLPCIHVHAWNQ